MNSRYIALPDGTRLALHRYTTGGTPVLYIHGATFPAALSVGFDFDGRSWADSLAQAGHDVWALDFIGYGASDRYPDGPDPRGTCDEAVQAISAAVTEILRETGAATLSIIAHSWGTLPAGQFAAQNPDKIARLVLFGPPALREGPTPTPAASTRQITLQAQYDRFTADVPKGAAAVLSQTHFAAWGAAYLASDPTSAGSSPPSVQVPGGPAADIARLWSGEFPYDPAQITCPVLVVRGEWDSVCDDRDAVWLFDALTNAPDKRDMKLARATHLAHLESGRTALYGVTEAFLAPLPEPKPVAVIFEVLPAEGRKADYLDIAARLLDSLKKIDGFISVERFQSLSDPAKILSLSFFRDEAAVMAWRNLPDHRAAQAAGRGGVFADYRLRVAHVMRDYGMIARDQAPVDSRAQHGA